MYNIMKKKESEGNFYPPTVVECDKSNSLTNEETFGPLFTLI
jgi:acyl-CoA reductase-like NAD-dependent aldehyde dehydrogenase